MLPSCPTPPFCIPAALWTRRKAATMTMAATGFFLAGCQTTAPLPWEPTPTLSTDLVVTRPAVTALPDITPPPASEVAPLPDPVRGVLEQTDRIVGLSAPDLSKEIARLSAVEEAKPENPLLLAIALSHTRQAVDTARALGLVQRVLDKNVSEEARALHPLARLVEARLLQQRRLEDQVEKQSQQLRDAQRRNDQLNERLEAVRAIERSLTTRPASTSSAPAPGSGSNTQRPPP